MQFLGIARGSALELQTQLELAWMLGFGVLAELESAQSLAAEEIKILNAALFTLRAKLSTKKK